MVNGTFPLPVSSRASACPGFGVFESEAWIPDTFRSLSLAHEVGNDDNS
jgi:hypothetical protein